MVWDRLRAVFTRDFDADRESEDPLTRFRATWYKLMVETMTAAIAIAPFAVVAALLIPNVDLSLRLGPGSILGYYVLATAWGVEKMWCWLDG